MWAPAVIWEVRETKDALAVGMSMKIWKVLFPINDKEHLHAVKPTGWWNHFKDQGENLVLQDVGYKIW